MELLVATWTVRLTLIGALGVAVLSLSAGATIVDAANRAAITAFVFTFAGRWLIGALETPEQRIARLRSRRGGKAGKAGKASKAAKGNNTASSAQSLPAGGRAA